MTLAQHNEIATTQQKQNATDLAQHNGNKPQNKINNTTETNRKATKLAQHNGNKPQSNEISTTQQKLAAKQRNWQHNKLAAKQRN